MLLCADYSQVELRVLAHLCGDPTLMEAFRGDQDIHRIVAAEVFGVPVEEVTAEQRRTAKTVNFGIIYGQTAFGLATTLRISRTQAAEFIDRYRKRFPRIDEFLRSCVAAAKANGYVETIFGRRRRIAGIDSRNPAVRGQAERLAINSVVQGSAADLIKQAMVNIAARIRREQRPSRLLLQIHDELLFETPAEAVEAEREMIVSEMSGAIRLTVPLKVDVGRGAQLDGGQVGVGPLGQGGLGSQASAAAAGTDDPRRQHGRDGDRDHPGREDSADDLQVDGREAAGEAHAHHRPDDDERGGDGHAQLAEDQHAGGRAELGGEAAGGGDLGDLLAHGLDDLVPVGAPGRRRCPTPPKASSHGGTPHRRRRCPPCPGGS